MAGDQRGTLRLRDGSRIRIRQIRPDDRSELADALAHMSAESRFRRFLSPIDELSERDRLGETTYRRAGHELVVAVPVPEPPGAGPRLLGLLRAAAGGLPAAVPRGRPR